MLKEVVFTRRASTALRKHANRAKAIMAKIDAYAADLESGANNVATLVGRDGKRLRVGDFRVLFSETADRIIVEDVGPRGSIYDLGTSMPVMTKTPRGEDIVILSRKEYDRLILEAEDRVDAAVLQASQARRQTGADELLTKTDLQALLVAKTPLAFWRAKRGISQASLAKAASIAQGFLSEIEAGKKTGDVKVLRKIATALDIALDDLVV